MAPESGSGVVSSDVDEAVAVVVEFPAQSQSQALCVSAALLDSVVEAADEDFVLSLVAVNSSVAGFAALVDGVGLASAAGTGTIYREVQASVVDAQAAEGTALVFAVELSQAVASRSEEHTSELQSP